MQTLPRLVLYPQTQANAKPAIMSRLAEKVQKQRSNGMTIPKHIIFLCWGLLYP